MMRTHLEFRSVDLLDAHEDGDIPRGGAVAELLGEKLPGYGFPIERIIPEDWGWCVMIAHDAFPLWVACGFYPEFEDGLLCFIHPSKPHVRKWLRTISTEEPVARLANALEDILSKNPKVHDLRWWTDAEVNSG